jgi:uncharacterized membrane protein YdjX (TVP38/TMEM64 family)
MATAAAGVSAVLILSLIAVKTVAGVVIFGVLWGYCAGVCASPAPFYLTVAKPSSSAKN